MRNGLIVVAATIFAIFLTLGVCEVFQVSEGREGVVVGEMLRTGDYVLPLRHGEIVPSKPPLAHWIGAGLISLFGAEANSEFFLRAPSAIAALALVLAVFLMINFLLGAEGALIGSFCLLTSNGFLRLAQDGRVDMLFCTLISSVLLVFITELIELKSTNETLKSLPQSTVLIMALLMGLSVLAKGPLGLVLPALVVASIAISEERGKGLWSLIRPLFGLALLIPLPWYIFAAKRGSQAFIGRQLLFENLERFKGGEGITVKPFWFYAKEIWAHCAPWSVISLLLLCVVFCRRKEVAHEWLSSPHVKAKLLLKYSSIWLLVTFVFLSLSAGKRAAYLLAILPPLALLLSSVYVLFVREWLYRVPQDTMRKVVKKLFFVVSGFGLVLLLAFRHIAIISDPKLIPLQVVLADSFYVIPLSVLFLLALLACSYSRIQNPVTEFIVICFIFMFLCYRGCLEPAVAVKGFTHSYKPFSKELEEKLPQGEELTFLKERKDESFDGLFFYYPHRIRIQPLSSELEWGKIYLTRASWLNELGTSNNFAYDILLQGGRMVDDPGETIVLFRPRREETQPVSFTQSLQSPGE